MARRCPTLLPGILLLLAAIACVAEVAEFREPAALTKAEGIIIPKMEVREVPIADVVERLRVLSREFDPDPAKKGVNIIFRPHVDNSIRITLSLTDVSLSNAAHYVAQAGDCRLIATDTALKIVPRRESPGPLITMEYRVSKELVSKLSGRSSRDYLELLGVDFPNGASAAFLPPNRLVMRNTWNAHDLIGGGVERLVSGPAANFYAAEIALPKISLRDVTVQQAVNDIRSKIPDNGDSDTTDSETRVKVDAKAAEKHVTLDLKGTTFRAALEFIAAAADLQLVRDKNGYALIPRPSPAP